MSIFNPENVSIIIVNYNGLKHLEKCLPSLLAAESSASELIVVDNHSRDGSREWVEKRFPAVRLLEIATNLGFGAANYRGAEKARGEFLVFLNNDTEVTPGWLTYLLKAFQEYPDLGAVCSTLELRDHPGIVNARGGTMTWLGFGQDADFGHAMQLPKGAASMPAYQEVLFPTAAAMMIRKTTFFALGGFDRRMFMYHEDVDLGWRLWLMGLKVLVSRDSIVKHLLGGTTRDHGGQMWIEMMGFRHNVRSLLKNYEWMHAMAAVGVFTASLLLRLRVSLLYHIWAWNIRRLPDTLRERRHIQKNRKIPDRELFQSGLIDTGRLSPKPRPELPRRDLAWGKRHWVTSPVLIPARDSAKGRLGPGWFPVQECAGRTVRPVTEAAECFLKVRPHAWGVLRVDALHWLGKEQTGRLSIECNGLRANYAIPANVIKTVLMDVQCDDNGILNIRLLSNKPKSLKLRHFKPPPPGFWAFPRIEFVGHDMREDPFKTIAVIIPTYNRHDILNATLSALLVQTKLPDEVIVIDDGSNDGTWEMIQSWQRRNELPFRFIPLRQRNAGQATARNRGIKTATSDLIAFLGDDTIPETNWLESHFTRQNALGYGCAVLGLTEWDEEQMKVTPFLRFINSYGAQFGYALISDGDEVPFTCFYTSNISLPRKYMMDQPFNEIFTEYGWEDLEVGYRLSLSGMRIYYHQAARTHHRHATTMATFLHRQYIVGRTCSIFLSQQPELTDCFTPQASPLLPTFLKKLALLVLLPPASRLDSLKIRLPRRLYYFFIGELYLRGFQDTATQTTHTR